MNAIMQFFNVNNTFFTIFGYPMSYIEFFGTLFNLWCVYLVMKKHILNWPIGIIGVILFASLFYQVHLYADLFEQWYYFVTGFIGWYAWAKARKPKSQDEEIVVERNSLKTNVYWAIGIGVFTILGTWVMTHLDDWLPRFFPVAASLPLLDTWTTIMSFAAQILMIQKRLENWVLWIVVDIIGIGLYWYKQVPFVALLYVIFLALATNGLITWHKTYRRQSDEKRTGRREILPTA